MLLSMTGFGEARQQVNGRSIAVEIRTLNNRYLKLSTKCPEPYGVLEPLIERVVRQTVRRGSVQVALRIDRQPAEEDYVINATALRSFSRQVQALEQELGLASARSIDALLQLPGVVLESRPDAEDPADQWPRIREVVEQALGQLQAMRTEEGRTMADELKAHCKLIGGYLDSIERRAPDVVTAYRDRLQQRVSAMLEERDVQIDQKDIIREVSIFAERSDIAEEIVRLRSHLEQFAAALDDPATTGRKLEFVCQEMFRETNTIGSKANDVAIAQDVVEIKGAVERIRELLQNVE